MQCLGLDRLPVVAGASDFYIGPSSLGTPTMNLSLFEQIARCTELTADGSSCAQLEGLAGVGLVDYAGDAASTPDTVERSQTSYLVTIGTTFTGVTPAEYAEQWPGLKADTIPAAEPTTVRGHDALEFYETVGRPAVVWQERPGVLVWVAVPPEREAELLAIAEGVQRVPGPTDIPWVQVVPEPGVAFDASNNNAEGMVVGRRGSLECVGLGYLASCGTDIASRMFVAGGMVATATPPEVAQVRVTFSSGSSLVEPEAKDGFTSRFVRVSVPDPATVELVEWLGADGTVIASTVPNPRDVASADPGAPPASS